MEGRKLGRCRRIPGKMETACEGQDLQAALQPLGKTHIFIEGTKPDKGKWRQSHGSPGSKTRGLGGQGDQGDEVREVPPPLRTLGPPCGGALRTGVVSHDPLWKEAVGIGSKWGSHLRQHQPVLSLGAHLVPERWKEWVRAKTAFLVVVPSGLFYAGWGSGPKSDLCRQSHL